MELLDITIGGIRLGSILTVFAIGVGILIALNVAGALLRSICGLFERSDVELLQAALDKTHPRVPATPPPPDRG